MKKLTLLGLVGITSIALTHAGWAAGRGGGGGGGGFHGGGFGGGHFGGGGGFHSGGFGGGGAAHGSPGARFSFGARPIYGSPVYARSATRAVTPSVRATSASSSRQQNRIASTGSRTAQTSRSPVAKPTDQRAMGASNHIFARHDNNWHHDWDHRGAHYSNGHWWCYDGAAWIGLDAGYYPWDYYPYYAYDYYPYDYYPGYYADVEPEYYNAGVSSSVDQTPDSNVTAVQTDLTKLGYYHGKIDGLFGRDTRDAVARYQTDQRLAVTGTLTTKTLESLGVPKVASN